MEFITRHTQGPWKVHKLNEPIGYEEFEVHFSDDGQCVAEVVHTEADAQLIAVAPKMIDFMIGRYKTLYKTKDWISSTREEEDDELKRIFDILKASGVEVVR